MYVQTVVEKSFAWIPGQCFAVIYQTLMLCFGPIWTSSDIQQLEHWCTRRWHLQAPDVHVYYCCKNGPNKECKPQNKNGGGLGTRLFVICFFCKLLLVIHANHWHIKVVTALVYTRCSSGEQLCSQLLSVSLGDVPGLLLCGGIWEVVSSLLIGYTCMCMYSSLIFNSKYENKFCTRVYVS